MLSRRRFLQSSSLISLSPWLPCAFGRAAQAAAPAPDGKVLVVVQLDGGNDGINTVVPYTDDAYGRVRETLRLETNRVHKLNDQVGLHPNMQTARELFDDGRLAIVQGVGYPNPDRSHFRSMRIWQTARFDDAEHNGYGWLGRALDAQRPIQTHGPGAIYVGEQETPVALWSRRSEALALARVEDLKLQGISPALSGEGSGTADSNTFQFVTKQMLSAFAAADEFARQELSANSAGAPSYPNSKLASQLKLVSQLIKSGTQARVFYTMQSGYDTHSAQLFTHANLLREFSDAVKALLNDLQASKAFSEFGRRVKENDSQGTDHGTAGPVFLAGTPVRGGLVGAAPDLSDLDGGDLKMQADFRQVYATLLETWLGVPAQDVLTARFADLPLIKA
jgi:uncharacterized protein (DUF1501 family)